MSRMMTTVAVAAGLGAAAATRADELLGNYISAADFGYFGVAEFVKIETFLSPDFGVFSGEGTLFEEDTYLPGGDGRVTEMTYGDDPDFERYVDLLTDGEDWWLYDQLNFSDGFMNGRFGRESDRLPPPEPDPNTPSEDLNGYPDLKGFDITRIVRTVEITMDSPGHNPNGDGNWTDISFFVSTEIYGVPEPGTALLGSLGALFALRRRR